MLYIKTVEPGTFTVLKKLMQVKTLQSFSLVGGTALALRHGHRTSVDLDLFYHKKFEHEPIVSELKEVFGKGYGTESKYYKWGIFCYINNVKVDIVYHPHSVICETETIENIRMYSDKDIVAMKINAILGRGKKKDFWDIYELLHHFSLKEIISFHEAKFPDQNLLITIPQAITYFDDADEGEDPRSLKGQTWPTIKKFIQKKVSEYLK